MTTRQVLNPAARFTLANPPREGHVHDGSDPYCDGCRTFAGQAVIP